MDFRHPQVDLALQHQDLVAQGEDLGVSLVASREQPSEPADDEVTDCRDEVHRWQTVPTHAAGNSRKHNGDGFPAPTRSGGFVDGLTVGPWIKG
jgi:hypothetical protein